VAYQIFDEDYALQLAHQLLDIHAIKLRPDEPFRWASGWSSPIYCDNRLALSYPGIRSDIKNKLATAIQRFFPDANALSGVATAGIPQGVLVADSLSVPFSYVRSKAKGHGMGNQIEGEVHSHQRVVVLEDLISTGNSSLQAIEALKEQEVKVAGLMAIFTYGFSQANYLFEEAHIPVVVLSDYNFLLDAAIQKNVITDSQLDLLRSWRKDPGNWMVS